MVCTRGGLMLAQPKSATLHRDHGVCRQDIDMVRLDTLVVADRQHRHGGASTDDFRQCAVAPLAKMGNDDKSNPRLWRYTPEQRLQRFDATRGGADADNQGSLTGQAPLPMRLFAR